MSVTDIEQDSGFFAFDIEHRCAASRFSRMWKYREPRAPRYGPPRSSQNLGGGELRTAIALLAQSVRHLCLYKLKHDDEHDELEPLSEHFYFENSQSVCQFLRQHSSLVPVLFQVRKKVDQYFGIEALTNLELLIDPEDNPSNPTLFALILTTLPANEATTRLEQLDDEWWLDQPHEVRRLMNIDVEYVNGRV